MSAAGSDSGKSTSSLNVSQEELVQKSGGIEVAGIENVTWKMTVMLSIFRFSLSS